MEEGRRLLVLWLMLGLVACAVLLLVTTATGEQVYRGDEEPATNYDLSSAAATGNADAADIIAGKTTGTYNTDKVADAARGTVSAETAKKKTYDATIAKAQELGGIAFQKVKENVNAGADTGKKTYEAAVQNSKAALAKAMETARKAYELTLEKAFVLIRPAAELWKKKKTTSKAEEMSDAATKQTQDAAEAAAEQAKKAYELAIEKAREAAEATSGTQEQTYDATTGKVNYETSDAVHIEQAKAKYAEAKGPASKMAAEAGEKLKNLTGKHEEF